MDKIEEVLTRGVAEVLPSKKQLEDVLRSGKKIKIYIGADPTAPKLHLGHSTNFLILKKLQDLGHKVIILIGDFTGMIGDPTDKNATRRPLTRKEVIDNAKTYKNQISKVLKFDGENPAEIKFNSKWLSKLDFEDILRLMAKFSVQQMIERDMFQQRLREGKSIGLHEFLYPLMQGYDSVAMDVDAEMGGTDQTFNMLIGRQLMKDLKNKEKFVVTTELLINPKTGKKLMSKSEGGYVGLDDEPDEMFGKIMALPDEVIEPCFRLCTNLDLSKIDFSLNPMELKKNLASEIVRMYHSEKDAEKARGNFEKTFQGKAPEYKDEIKNKGSLVDTLEQVVGSKSEAKRLIKQGGVDVNGVKIVNLEHELAVGDKINLGKRRFLKVK